MEDNTIKNLIKEQKSILSKIDKKLTKEERKSLTRAFEIEHELTILENQ